MRRVKRTALSLNASIAVLLLLPATAAFAQSIVGISIACSNDHVYAWFADRRVTSGTSSNLGSYQPPHAYSLPAGKTPADVIGVGIAGNDHVYAWYRDGTASSGTSTDLGHYRAPYHYSLPAGKTTADVVGIDIACSNDHVYAWYKDGTASSGTSDDLGKYRAPYAYSLPAGKTPADILETGIAGNDHVYVWYRDLTVTSGTSDHLDTYRAPYSYVLGLGPCSVTAGTPQLNTADHVIFAVVNRGPSCETTATMKISLNRDVPFWFDPTLASKTIALINGDVAVQYRCAGTSTGQNVYVEVESEGRKSQSSRAAIQFCN